MWPVPEGESDFGASDFSAFCRNESKKSKRVGDLGEQKEKLTNFIEPLDLERAPFS